jgi:hypothetical protein
LGTLVLQRVCQSRYWVFAVLIESRDIRVARGRGGPLAATRDVDAVGGHGIDVTASAHTQTNPNKIILIEGSLMFERAASSCVFVIQLSNNLQRRDLGGGGHRSAHHEQRLIQDLPAADAAMAQ